VKKKGTWGVKKDLGTRRKRDWESEKRLGDEEKKGDLENES